MFNMFKKTILLMKKVEKIEQSLFLFCVSQTKIMEKLIARYREKIEIQETKGRGKI